MVEARLRISLNTTPIMKALHEIRPGDSARLSRFTGGDRSFQRRLMELGFLPGTRVRLVRSVSVGDLVELEVRGSHISLRRSEASEMRFEAEG
jgi:Fe2+ transport system protein FeoA